MPIATGARLPQATFKVMAEDKSQDLTTDQVFAGKKVALFAVPGAFTPTCSVKHLPGFLSNDAELRKAGIDTIACTAVNDQFVLAAWAEQTGAGGHMLMLGDPTAAFAKAVGLSTEGALGTRSLRYAAFVDDGVVRILNVEPQAGQAEVAGAERLLRDIKALG